MITELKQLENPGTYYADLFGIKVCHDMPSNKNDPTLIKRAQEAAEKLRGSIFPPELLELLKR